VAYLVKLLELDKVIEIEYIGKVTNKELKDALTNALSLSKEKQVNRYLANCTQMRGGHSVVDLFNLVSDYRNEIKADLSAKEAILSSQLPEIAPLIHFFEMAATNRGYNVKIFRDRDEALAWLKE
jgi:hypothetical protein